jgi:hypothetical protein
MTMLVVKNGHQTHVYDKIELCAQNVEPYDYIP